MLTTTHQLITRRIARTRVAIGRLALWCQLPFKELSCRLDRFIKRHKDGRRSCKPDILLVASGPLELEYLEEVGTILRKHTEGRVFLGSDLPKASATEFGRISPSLSKWRWWDLIVFADHAPLAYPLLPPSMIVLHGLVRSRVVADGSYQYDRTRILRRGRPVYDVMVDVSEEAAEWAANLVPEVGSRIRVVGDLKTDRLLATTRDRPPSERQLVVMSTWGPHSLMEAHGKEAIAAIRDLVLNHGWTATISTHPNLWRGETKPWQDSLRHLEEIDAVEVLPPGADWVDALASAAIALSDHTSLVGPYALLERPLVLAPVSENVIGEGTFPRLLYRHCPVIQDWQELSGVLESAVRRGSPSPVRSAARHLVTFPGEAESRLCDVADGLLTLAKPTSTPRPSGAHRPGPASW